MEPQRALRLRRNKMEKQQKENKIMKETDKKQLKSEPKEEMTKQKTTVEVKKIEENKEIQKKEEVESKVSEKKPETNLEKKEKKQTQKITKKDEAIVNGKDLHASKRQCMYICNFIKNKPIDLAISQLNEVLKLKRAIPFKGEIPHRKGNMMSGRYPVNASKIFITILKNLRGNVIVNGMDLESTKIVYCSASWASRPAKAGGARFKRTHVLLKARETK